MVPLAPHAFLRDSRSPLRNLPPLNIRWSRILYVLPWLMTLLLLAGAPASQAAAIALQGNWYAIPICPTSPPVPPAQGIPVNELSRTNGHACFFGGFTLAQATDVVIDFKSSTVIGRFTHTLLGASGKVIARAEGGIQSSMPDPFFLRHGRPFHLPAGRYTLVTQLDSPFLLAQPQPFIDTLDHYRQAIKAGDALTLVSMGILLGLMFYYATLAVIRKNATDLLYALFLLGNLLYNGTALLIWPELLHLHGFYLISFPVLFSNMAYVLFVMRLLDIHRDSHPILHISGVAVLALLGAFVIVALARPHWSLELDRAGVALFLTYGLASGVIRTRQKQDSALTYLFAVVLFFIMGILSISLEKMSGDGMITVEHLGLAAVTVEAMLLALVVARQFSLLQRQYEYAWAHAMQDALTGLKNRRGFLEAGTAEIERARRYGRPLSIIFIDLDNFKQLNDSKGHDVGDTALKMASRALSKVLRSNDLLARLGGDEFAVLLPEIGPDASAEAARKLFRVVNMALQDFPPVTASMGVICFSRVRHSFATMLKFADELMYEVKKSGKNNMRIKHHD